MRHFWNCIRQEPVPYCVSMFLLIAGVLKIVNMEDFAKVANQISFLPTFATHYLPLFLPLSEILLALMIVWSNTRVIALICTCLLFIAFIGFHVWNILYGHIVSCHCLGVENVLNLSFKVNAIMMISLLSIAILMVLSWLFEDQKEQHVSPK